MGGAGDKIKGKANELAGKVTGDRTQQMKGKAQQGKGEVKDQAEKADRELREDEQDR